jgi:hypothetical protein
MHNCLLFFHFLKFAKKLDLDFNSKLGRTVQPNLSFLRNYLRLYKQQELIH